MASSLDTERSLTIVSQYFHPDMAGSGIRITELATGLEQRGHDVSVLTTQPSYSSADRDRGRFSAHDTYKGVAVQRVPSTRLDKNRFLYRLINDLSFFLVSLFVLCRKPDDELLLFTTVPPFLPLAGLVTRLFGNDHLVLVHDLHPQMATELGYLSEGGLIYRVWMRLNSHVYRRAEHIVVLSERMAERIRADYGVDCTVSVVHNWEDGSTVQPLDKCDNEFAREHGLVDRFTVLYSGNLGQFHDLQPIVEAAELLECQSPELTQRLQFLFIGEGGKKQTLEDIVRRRDISTVSFLPYQPRDRLSESLTCGDVAVVAVEPSVTGLCVSGKFYTALASGQAVLAIAEADSEIGTVVDESGCGVRVDPGSSEQVVEAIEFWLKNPETCDEMGRRARQLFEDKFSKTDALETYDSLITSLY